MPIVIEIVMMAVAAIMLMATKVNVDEVPKTATLRAGVVAVIGIFGLAWLGDSFIAAHKDVIVPAIGDWAEAAPWTFAFGLFFASVLLYSQAATTRALMPLGIALGIPPQFLIAMFPSVNGYFFIPTYGSLIAAINFDLSGTTKIGKYVLNHSFMIPGLVATVGGGQPQQGDLRWRAKPLGRAPVAGAAAGVDPQVLQPVQPGGEGLLKAHEQVPGPELAAMGVARQLHVKACFAGLRGAARLVGQQQTHARVGRGTGDGGVRVAAMRLVEMVGAPVGHTGHHQRGLPAVFAMAQHHVLVHQHGQAQTAQRLDPGVCARVVLVVARHKEGAMARAQASQRRHMGAQLRHRAVNQVAGHGHHVRTQVVHGVHDALQVAVADRGSDVDIADLCHGEAVQCRRQPGHRHLHGHDGRRAPCVQKAQRGHQRGRQQHRERAGVLQRGALPRCGVLGNRQHADQRVGQAGQQPHRVPRQRQHEQ
jgi:hypothetical protein